MAGEKIKIQLLAEVGTLSELTALWLFDLRLDINKIPINTNKIGTIHNTIVEVVIGGS